MDSNGGAVHTNRLKVCSAGEVGENLLPKWRVGPAIKTFVHGLPGAECLWEVTPRSAIVENPKDAIEHEAGRAMAQGVAKGRQRCRGGSFAGDAVIACIVKELFENSP